MRICGHGVWPCFSLHREKGGSDRGARVSPWIGISAHGAGVGDGAPVGGRDKSVDCGPSRRCSQTLARVGVRVSRKTQDSSVLLLLIGVSREKRCACQDGGGGGAEPGEEPVGLGMAYQCRGRVARGLAHRARRPRESEPASEAILVGWVPSVNKRDVALHLG